MIHTRRTSCRWRVSRVDSEPRRHVTAIVANPSLSRPLHLRLIGLKPNAEFLGDTVKRGAGGFLVTNDTMETSMPGFSPQETCVRLDQAAGSAVGMASAFPHDTPAPRSDRLQGGGSGRRLSRSRYGGSMTGLLEGIRCHRARRLGRRSGSRRILPDSGADVGGGATPR